MCIREDKDIIRKIELEKESMVSERIIDTELNKEYEINILDAYYIEVSNNDFYKINRDEFEIDVQCSKIMNYAGIVLAHIVNGWDNTEWYKLNLKNMIKGVKEI